MAVRIGKPAPEFEGEAWTRGAHGPKKVGLSQHRGKWVILFFYSKMMWYAGGRYIYMHFEEGSPQIWQILQILPDELRLRHAKRDYTFKRI